MSINELGTVAGLATAATLGTEVVKRLFGVGGRGAQLTAVVLAVSLAILARWQGVGTDVPWLETVLNGVLAGAASIGIYEGASYRSEK